MYLQEKPLDPRQRQSKIAQSRFPARGGNPPRNKETQDKNSGQDPDAEILGHFDYRHNDLRGPRHNLFDIVEQNNDLGHDVRQDKKDGQTTQNKNNAQLIFTTHNTNLLDQEIFRRDQIWFTEKRNEGSTDLYSLMEYSPRKDKNIEKGYLAGRYGAIPFIKENRIF